ncbi:MAG: uncharacterized protein A8A55_0502 [Amphiamblys sp. WSBS2006]|nr:MAG: uncharacterized protein A8A55_0502 [Amphiamblys sp. WSBS2006]
MESEEVVIERAVVSGIVSHHYCSASAVEKERFSALGYLSGFCHKGRIHISSFFAIGHSRRNTVFEYCRQKYKRYSSLARKRGLFLIGRYVTAMDVCEEADLFFDKRHGAGAYYIVAVDINTEDREEVSVGVWRVKEDGTKEKCLFRVGSRCTSEDVLEEHQQASEMFYEQNKAEYSLVKRPEGSTAGWNFFVLSYMKAERSDIAMRCELEHLKTETDTVARGIEEKKDWLFKKWLKHNKGGVFEVFEERLEFYLSRRIGSA